jgi:hypothetical protein
MVFGPKEPSYNTRPLSNWALIYYTNHNFRVRISVTNSGEKNRNREEAALAIKTIGTNALPYLLDWLTYRRPKWKDKVAGLPLPNSLWWEVNTRLNRDDELHAAAPEVIELLGQTAGTLGPKLHTLAKTSSSATSRDRLLLILAHLGQAGLNLLKADLETGSLQEAFAATKALWTANHIDNVDIGSLVPSILLYESRCAEAGEDTLVGPDAAKYLPNIMCCSTNSNPMIRAAAVQQLAWMAYRYPEAVAYINLGLDDLDPKVRLAATNATSVMLPPSQKTLEDYSHSDRWADMFGHWVGTSKYHFRVTLSQTNVN